MTRRVDKDKVREILTRINADTRELYRLFEVGEYELSAEKPKKRAASKPKDAEMQKTKAEFFTYFYQQRKKYLHGAQSFRHPNHPQQVEALLETYGLERLKLMAQALMTTNEEWIASTSRGIEILHGKAEWLDMKLREHGL